MNGLTPERLLIHFETSTAIKLLQAKSAPLVVSFLHQHFKQTRVIAIPHSEFLPALKAYQERLQEIGYDGLRDKAEEYLRDWSSAGKRWLHRFLESGRDEPMYQLTPHSEVVIEFLEHALQQDLTFVGTESRLRLVIQTLEELLVGSSDDPEVRLQHLRDEQARIAAEIASIEQHGLVTTFGPTRIREQFSLAVRMLRQLQGDFRAVEDKFKEITRQVQQRQVLGVESRGGILGDALGAEDELKRQDQGVSFFEFLKFIQSPQRQDRLQAVIKQLLQLHELADQAEGLETIRHMVRGLLDEAEKVLQTTRRLSASLRRLIDTRSQQEQRRVTELLRQIRVLAASMSDAPPRTLGIEINDAIPMSRTNWAHLSRFERIDLTEHIADEALRREVFRQFLQLRPIDWGGMRRRVRQALEPRGHCTLRELLDDEPPEGLLDVLGYLQIACDDRHLIRPDATDEFVLPDGKLGMVAVSTASSGGLQLGHVRWRCGSKEVRGFGYSVEWRQKRSRAFGHNPFLVRIFFESQNDFLRLISKLSEFAAFVDAVDRLRAEFSELNDWIRSHRQLLVEVAPDLDGLLEVLRYFRADPRPNRFARELPLSVDTKFLERYECVLRDWFDLVLPPNSIRSDTTGPSNR